MILCVNAIVVMNSPNNWIITNYVTIYVVSVWFNLHYQIEKICFPINCPIPSPVPPKAIPIIKYAVFSQIYNYPSL